MPTSTLPASKRTLFTRIFWLTFSPVRMTTGNSSPFAPCTVIMRTASSSDSGTGASVTRAPSSACRCTHPRKARSELPPATAKARALLDKEAVAAPLLPLALLARGGFHQEAFADEAVDERGGCRPHSTVVRFPQHFKGLRDFNESVIVRPAAVAQGKIVEGSAHTMESQQFNVGAGESGRSAERRLWLSRLRGRQWRAGS